MKVLRWFAVSFSMYSKIPMPRFEWKEDDMAHSLVFFPFVGIVIGALIVAFNYVPVLLDFPVALRAILTLFIPLFITGGFHVDGFMDTEDALSSYGSREKKLEILKDSHIGAFAVISLVKWGLVYAFSVTAILLSDNFGLDAVVVFTMTFVISRCFSGITSLALDKAKKDGMLYEETRKNQKGIVIWLTILLIGAFATMIIMNAIYGAVVAVVFIFYTEYYRHRVRREFGGVTGDTAGFYLTTSEILAALALAVTMIVV